MVIGFTHIDIVGDRVRLRPIRATDAKTAYHLLADEAILSWLCWDGPADEKEVFHTYRLWEAELKTGPNYSLAIERLDKRGIIGSISARLWMHPSQADIGYWLGTTHWGKGYMTDAIRLACHFCFKHLNVVRVYAPVFVGNIRSRRSLEKNGFTLDGTLRCHIIKRGKWRDAWFFTLLRSEWEDKHDWFYPQHEEVVVSRF